MQTEFPQWLQINNLLKITEFITSFESHAVLPCHWPSWQAENSLFRLRQFHKQKIHILSKCQHIAIELKHKKINAQLMISSLRRYASFLFSVTWFWMPLFGICGLCVALTVAQNKGETLLKGMIFHLRKMVKGDIIDKDSSSS